MSRIVYLNGSYLPETDAKISIFDRGFLMADAIYEVVSVLSGKLIDYEGHVARLWRCLGDLDIKSPIENNDMLDVMRQLISRNNIEDGLVYLQISRGNPGDRDFIWPDPSKTAPTIVMFTQNKPGLANSPLVQRGLRVITIDDLRWARRDIKTVQLLYPSMGKMMAVKAGVDDAWMVQDGLVTEGTSNNAYIIKDKQIITRALSHAILPGITRSAVLRFAEQEKMDIVERNFSVEEAQAADEAFATSATLFVMPVVEINGHPIGTGKPGETTLRLRELYLEISRIEAI